MSLSDILYFSHKVNQGFNPQCEVDNEAIDVLTRVQVYDTLLYDAAVVALDDHIGRYGSSFSADLARFERALGRLSDLCGENSTKWNTIHPQMRLPVLLSNATKVGYPQSHPQDHSYSHNITLDHVSEICTAMKDDHVDFVNMVYKFRFYPKPLPDVSFFFND